MRRRPALVLVDDRGRNGGWHEDPAGINASWWLIAVCCSLTLWAMVIGSILAWSDTVRQWLAALSQG